MRATCIVISWYLISCPDYLIKSTNYKPLIKINVDDIGTFTTGLNILK